MYSWGWNLRYFPGQSLKLAGSLLARPGWGRPQRSKTRLVLLKDLPIPYRRSPPHPPRPTPRFGETNSPALFLIRTFPTQCLSLSPCREQTSWSPSLNPSALSPPHSFTRESRAPEARRGGRAQDVRGPGSGAGKGLGAGWGLARILDSSGGREAWIPRGVRLLRPSCLPPHLSEPALRRPGSYGPQKVQPTVPSGPC